MNAFKIGTAFALLLATSATAQERIRSGGLPSGFEPVTSGSCEEWDIGFEASNCRRMPFPGDQAEFVQVYKKKSNGQSVSFIADPKSSEQSSTAPKPTDPPTRTVQSAQPAQAAAPTATTPAATTQSSARLPNHITVFPGRSELIPVAVGHLNRFETPFPNPTVRTSAEPAALSVEFDDNYIYAEVAQAVTLFIHDKGHPDPAITVSLIPRQIAPRQVKLSVPASLQRQIDSNRAKDVSVTQATPRAKELPRGMSYGSGEPHVQRVATILKEFGLGDVSRGFRKGSVSKYSIGNYCRPNSGVKFSFSGGQMYYDQTYILLIGRATSNSRRELQEVWCAAHPATAAIAFPTRTIISKGKASEVMILLRRDIAENPSGSGRKSVVIR